jgi:tRNA pseudouridine38-40 synthase
MAKVDGARTQILVRFGYDGAAFHGLQPQAPGIATAGGTLRDRLTAAFAVAPKMLHFSARTDAGVHADANAATCYFRGVTDIDLALSTLMANRGDGLVNVRAEVVPVWVHARGSARGKRYRYRVHGGVETPTTREHHEPDRWAVAPMLDVERMQRAASLLTGTHDFTSLRHPKCTATDPNKTLASVHVCADQDGSTVVEVVGDSFLRQMVRNLVGLLVEVGSGWRPESDVPRVLAARERTAAGLLAPAEGLTLVDVGFLWPPDGSGLLPELGDLGRPAPRPSGRAGAAPTATKPQ